MYLDVGTRRLVTSGTRNIAAGRCAGVRIDTRRLGRERLDIFLFRLVAPALAPTGMPGGSLRAMRWIALSFGLEGRDLRCVDWCAKVFLIAVRENVDGKRASEGAGGTVRNGREKWRAVEQTQSRPEIPVRSQRTNTRRWDAEQRPAWRKKAGNVARGGVGTGKA
ncbi:hypothetical protein TRVL_04713 [Trypanosoma vivax]|nr:hypothetical protein TRVL_04713 [Trypanosoma vivax]